MRVLHSLPVLLVVAVITWFPSFDAPYAEDDWLFLEAVSRADAPAFPHYLLHEGVMDHHYRPISDPGFFALAHRLFGLDPVGWHLLLVAAVVLTGLAVVRLACALGLGGTAALIAGCIYVSRDFAYPSLIWASGFSDVGSALFGMTALWLFARWLTDRSRRLRIASVAAFALAILTKETAIVIVGLALLLYLFRTSGRTGAWPRVRGIAGALWPLLLVGIPVAIVQLRLARFDEAYGQELYALEPGAHLFAIWPVYLLWSFVGVREAIDASGLRWALIVAAYAALATAVIVARRARSLSGQRSHDEARVTPGAVALFGCAWLIIGLGPALLAPGRVLTNYLALPAVGPIIAVAAALAYGLHARASLRAVAVAAIALILLVGPVLVHLKDRGSLATGGWVSTASAVRMTSVLDAVERELPSPSPDARLIIFGATAYDIRVLGNPRGRGFGEQSALASAMRVRYGRSDIDVLSLPPVPACRPQTMARVGVLLREAPQVTYLLETTAGLRNLTAVGRDVTARGGDPSALRRALIGS